MRKDATQAKREAWATTGQYWHKHMRPKHFTKQGAAEYGYLKRKGEGQEGTKFYHRSYTGRKLRKFGHTNPMVYTGESLQMSRMRDVRSTGKGARVVMHTPKLNLRHPKSRIRMPLELRIISRGEAKELAEVFDADLDKRLANVHVQQFDFL